jgi:hypothetical protein
MTQLHIKLQTQMILTSHTLLCLLSSALDSLLGGLSGALNGLFGGLSSTLQGLFCRLNCRLSSSLNRFGDSNSSAYGCSSSSTCCRDRSVTLVRNFSNIALSYRAWKRPGAIDVFMGILPCKLCGWKRCRMELVMLGSLDFPLGVRNAS